MNIVKLIVLSLALIACNDRSDFDNAQKEYNKGKLTDAKKKIDDFLRSNKESVAANLLRARINLSLKDTLNAIQDYRNVLNFDNENTFAYYQAARLYNEMHNYGKSDYWINLAIDKKGGGVVWNTNAPRVPYDVPLEKLIFLRGELGLKLGDFNRSFSDFDFCILHKYRWKESEYNKGLAAIKLNYDTQAYMNMKTARDLGHPLADSVLMLFDEVK